MLNWIKNLSSKEKDPTIGEGIPNTELSPESVLFVEYHKNKNEEPIYLLFEGNEQQLRSRYPNLNLRFSKELPEWVSGELWKKLASKIYNFQTITTILK